MEFVYQIDNHLPKEICEEMIEKYINDPGKTKATVGNDTLKEHVRKSTVLEITTGGENWNELDKYLENNLKEGLEKYKEYLSQQVCPTVIENIFNGITSDSGYSIQAMKKGDFYTWHVDECVNNDNSTRLVTAMWYLNTLEEDDGGHTEFWMRDRIRPKQGSLLFFPSCWSYIHRGAIVRNDVTKYTCITWLINNPTM
jgi:Rps23 Pro-64 3,4-dihydroxylase Tpa1-like proline 4-hydroxylase